MQYREFLRLAGAREDACSYWFYAKKIEPAYMDYDDLFTTKEDVVAYWRAYGSIGFTSERLALVRRAITALRDCCYFSSGLRRFDTEGLETWIVKAAAKRSL